MASFPHSGINFHPFFMKIELWPALVHHGMPSRKNRRQIIEFQSQQDYCGFVVVVFEDPNSFDWPKFADGIFILIISDRFEADTKRVRLRRS